MQTGAHHELSVLELLHDEFPHERARREPSRHEQVATLGGEQRVVTRDRHVVAQRGEQGARDVLPLKLTWWWGGKLAFFNC